MKAKIKWGTLIIFLGLLAMPVKAGAAVSYYAGVIDEMHAGMFTLFLNDTTDAQGYIGEIHFFFNEQHKGRIFIPEDKRLADGSLSFPGILSQGHTFMLDLCFSSSDTEELSGSWINIDTFVQDSVFGTLINKESFEAVESHLDNAALPPYFTTLDYTDNTALQTYLFEVKPYGVEEDKGDGNENTGGDGSIDGGGSDGGDAGIDEGDKDGDDGSVDKSGNDGDDISPDETVSLNSGSSGGGCQLSPDKSDHSLSLVFFLLSCLFLWRKKHKAVGSIIP